MEPEGWRICVWLLWAIIATLRSREALTRGPHAPHTQGQQKDVAAKKSKHARAMRVSSFHVAVCGSYQHPQILMWARDEAAPHTHVLTIPHLELMLT